MGGLLERVLHINDDPVSRLYAHYFLQADVLFGYLKTLDGEKPEKDNYHKAKRWMRCNSASFG